MRLIGLTGGIACGKSNVSDMLRTLGCTIVDGDLLARRLTAPGGEALDAIRTAFGDAVFKPDGTLDRKRLGNIVFNDPREKQKLDLLMSPLLERLTEESIRAARDSGADFCVLDMPLLYEKGYDRYCDTVWCVSLPPETQLQRLMERDSITREAAIARIRSSWPCAKKASLADTVIDTSGSIEYTRSLIPELLDKEREKTRRRRRTERYDTRRDANVNDAHHAYPDAQRTDTRPQTSAAAAHKPEDGYRRSAPPRDAAAFPRNREPERELPSVMERPHKELRKPSPEKPGWRLPSWLFAALVTVTLLVIASVTALALMNAYLTQQKEAEEAAQRQILLNYPLVYRDTIEKYAKEFNLNPAFVAATILNESSFDPHAVSSVGARGLMQTMPKTAEWIAHKLGINVFNPEMLFEPDINVRFGCWYQNYLSRLFGGNTVSVISAYHAGQGEIAGWLSDPAYSDDGIRLILERLPEGPTKNYAKKVTRDYGIYQKLYFSPDPGNNGMPASDSADM